MKTILIVSLKKLTSGVKKLIKKNYSVLEYRDSLHKNKNLSELGKSDVLLFELGLHLFVNLSSNSMMKYLKEQDLSKFDVCFVYDKTKYKSLFSDYKWCIRKLPFFHGKTLDVSIEDQHQYDAETKSVMGEISSEDISEIMLDGDITEETLSRASSPCSQILSSDSVSYFSIKKQIEGLKVTANNLEKFYSNFKDLEALYVEMKKRDDEKIEKKDDDGLEKKIEKVEVEVEKKHKLIELNKMFVIKNGNNVHSKYFFRSLSHKSKARKRAEEVLETLD